MPFAVAAGWIGLATERLWLAFSGLPASGLITAVFGNDLFLAWPLDAIVWITAGVWIGRRAVTPRDAARPALVVIAGALILGSVLGLLVVPA